MKRPPSVTAYTAEKIVSAGIKQQADLMYYVKDGDIWAVPRRKPGGKKEKATRLLQAGISMEYDKYLYFIDGDGDIARKRRRGPAASNEKGRAAAAAASAVADSSGLSRPSWLARAGSPLILAEDERSIARAQRALREALFGAGHARPRELPTGHRGGPALARAVWFEKQDFWYGANEEHNRYWNGFGLGNPFDDRAKRSIVAEVNPVKEGRDARVQGAFAKADGRMLLIHRGRLGGGKSGVGGGFLDWYPLSRHRSLSEGGRETQVIAIGPIDDARELLDGLHDFVRLAASYKAGDAPPRPHTDAISAYRPEFSGQSSYVRPEREVDADWLHGRVVDVLKGDLAAHGYTARNDKYRDLYVEKASCPVLLFEVKTSHALQDLYTAVGQLQWHAKGDAYRVIVVPSGLAPESRARLDGLGLNCITFDVDPAGVPRVSGLAELLHRWRRRA